MNAEEARDVALKLAKHTPLYWRIKDSVANAVLNGNMNVTVDCCNLENQDLSEFDHAALNRDGFDVHWNRALLAYHINW